METLWQSSGKYITVNTLRGAADQASDVLCTNWPDLQQSILIFKKNDGNQTVGQRKITKAVNGSRNYLLRNAEAVSGSS